jgi:rubredoxin-NAD+ reductase
MDPVIIVGTGLAGFNLVKEFRKLDKETPLVMLTSDDGRNYSKPMLSNGFAKQKTADDLAMAQPEQVAETLNVTIRHGVTVTAIDAVKKHIQLGDETLNYSKLVLGLGADVFRPPLEGDGQASVYAVNDLVDYGTFRQALEGKKNVLILGGGLIGCEFANDLASADFAVSVVEPLGRCLPTLLPEPASTAVQQGLESMGVKFHFGPLAKAVHAEGNGVSVELSDGARVSADIVLSAVGLRPRISLAKEAGLQVNRGIVVDRHLKTSDDDIFALGDCAEVEGYVLPYILPLMASSRALAKTLTGDATEVSYGVMPVTIKTPACPIVVCPAPHGLEGAWVCEGEGLDIKALFRDETGTLCGYALTGAAVSEKQKLNKELPALLP